MAPTLGVVMPVYMGAATLARTLGSLVGQAVDEVVAVYQPGPDASRAILESFAGKLPLRILDAPDSRDWMTNTNIGFAAAGADILSMLHQDDLWRPGRGRLLRELAETHPAAALLLHPADYIDDADRIVGRFGPPFGRRRRLVPQAEALEALLVQNTVALPAAAFPRAAALAVGGLSPELWYTADWDFWLKLVRRGPVAWTPDRAAAFRVHGGSQTVTRSRDLDGFRAQLAAPVAAHLDAAAARRREGLRALAEASNRLNAHLAARLHGTPDPAWPVFRALLALGPAAWPRFLGRTQIVPRVTARLRALGRQRSGPRSGS